MRPGMLLLSPLLLAFAPAPKSVALTDPDKAIEQFLKEAPALKKKGADALDARKKKLLTLLKKIKADLEKKGKKKEATAAGDRLVLAGVFDGEVTLDKIGPAALLKKAANGKYGRLLHVMHLPQDKANYKEFSDYGYYTGTSYYNHMNLSVGYWVYVYPFWFIWGDGPGVPGEMTLLLTGASGQLGAYVLRHLVEAGEEVRAWSGSRRGELSGVPLSPVELTDAEMVRRAFAQDRPAVVLHAAALAKVADCHRDPERARCLNVGATELLASLCAESRARLVLVSTDLVFDGESPPYREDAPPTHLSIYGHTKANAERVALTHAGNAVARVSLLVGPSLLGRPSFFDEQAAAMRGGRPVKLFADEWRTPLDLPTAARALAELARSEAAGLFHIGGPERLSRVEMGQRLARALGVSDAGIVAVNRADVPAAEPRPRDTSLDSSRWREAFPGMPWLEHETALRRMLGA